MIRKFICAAALAAAAALGAAVPASASTATVAYGFGYSSNSGWGHPLVRPGYLYIGNGEVFVKNITWGSWGHWSASGHGTRWTDNCIPNCAQGTYHKKGIHIALWRVRYHNGQRYFSRMGWYWVNSRTGVHHKEIWYWSRHGGTVYFWDL